VLICTSIQVYGDSFIDSTTLIGLSAADAVKRHIIFSAIKSVPAMRHFVRDLWPFVYI